MTLSQAVAHRILQLCNERNISINKLSLICGITQSTVNNIINGGSKNPTISTIKKICDGMDMSLSEFFDCELFSSLDQELK